MVESRRCEPIILLSGFGKEYNGKVKKRPKREGVKKRRKLQKIKGFIPVCLY